jgi:hypothetical protein
VTFNAGYISFSGSNFIPLDELTNDPVSTIASVDGALATKIGNSNSGSFSSIAPNVGAQLTTTSSTLIGTGFNSAIGAYSVILLDPNNGLSYAGTVNAISSTTVGIVLPSLTTFKTADPAYQAGSPLIVQLFQNEEYVIGKAIFTYPIIGPHLTIIAPPSTTAGAAFSFTVAALDAANATLTSYVGTVHFTSTDGAAVLSANYTFTSSDNGSHVFNNTLSTAGPQIITATDTLTASINGTSGAITVAPASPPSIPTLPVWAAILVTAILSGLGALLSGRRPRWA